MPEQHSFKSCKNSPINVNFISGHFRTLRFVQRNLWREERLMHSKSQDNPRWKSKTGNWELVCQQSR